MNVHFDFSASLNRDVINCPISEKALINFVNHRNFTIVESYRYIRPISSNFEEKTKEKHFATVLLGKIAEYLTAKFFYYSCCEQSFKDQNATILFSPKDEIGREISDLVIVKALHPKGLANRNPLDDFLKGKDLSNYAKYKTIEVRSSFIPSPHKGNKLIIAYRNSLKKHHETYKDYYFQAFFLISQEALISRLRPIYQHFSQYRKYWFKQHENNLEKETFAQFLARNNYQIGNELICQFQLAAFSSKDFALKHLISDKDALKQSNTYFEHLPIHNTLSIKEAFNLIRDDLNIC